MYFDYLNVLVFCSVGFVFVFLNMIVGSIIRPKRPTRDGLEIYECGEETIGDAWIQFDIRYYTVALIYVIFAVEIAFLFPWAMVLSEAFANPAIGTYALWKGVLFVTILFLGLAAVWVKGDLDWVLTYTGPEYVPTAQKPSVKVPSMDELLASESEEEADADDDESADEAAA